MSGYDVLRSLRVGKVKTPVLILSGYAGIEDKVRALGVGADDYVTKPFHKDELIARIHAIVRRSMGHAEPTVKCGDLTVKPEAKQAEIAGRTVPLTGKEYGMLEFLALRQCHTITKEMFLNQLYGGRARAEDHRRVHLQAAQEARRGFRREELYRDRLGSRVRASGAGAGEARRVDSPLLVNRELPGLRAVSHSSGVPQLGIVSLRFGHRTSDEVNESVKAGLVQLGF